MILIATLIGLAILGFVLWAVIDIASTPSSAFEAAGQSRALWLTLILGLTLVCGLPGFIVAVVYLWSIGPKIAASRPPS